MKTAAEANFDFSANKSFNVTEYARLKFSAEPVYSGTSWTRPFMRAGSTSSEKG